jgi:hypothetical protein
LFVVLISLLINLKQVPVLFYFIGADQISYILFCSRTRFQRYRVRRDSFSHFAFPVSFWAVPRVPGPVFMFCASVPVFNGIEGARFSFHVLRSRTHFRRYRGRRISFSASGLIFGGTEGIGSSFNVLHSRTRFRRYRGRQV